MPKTRRPYVVARLQQPELWVRVLAIVLFLRSIAPFLNHGSVLWHALGMAAGDQFGRGQMRAAIEIYWSFLRSGGAEVSGLQTAVGLTLDLTFGCVGLFSAILLFIRRPSARLAVLWLVGLQAIVYTVSWIGGLAAGMGMQHDLRSLAFFAVTAIVLLRPQVRELFAVEADS